MPGVDCFFFFFKQKTAYEIVDCDWSSDVCSSDLGEMPKPGQRTANTEVFSRLKEAFLEYANELIAEGKEIGEIVDRPIIGNRYDEGMWRQLQFVIYFWVKDDSQNFERTDEAIEKAVNLSFDIMGRGPIDAALDFAKFLYQQR